MRKTLAFALVSLLLILGLFPAAAQNDDNAFLRMLARIPDTAGAREWLTYVDYRALIAARQGAVQVTSWSEFELANNSNSEPAHQLMMALLGVHAGPQFFTNVFTAGADMADVVGFDPFTVERAAEFSQPPAMTTILEGDFDRNAVIAAHAARSYSESQLGDLTLLCGADGCDSGTMINMRNINRANPFGGELGRSQPVLVGDGLVASSPSINMLEGTAETINGSFDSLASDPDYSAAAEALGTAGPVLQAYIFNPADILPLSEALAGLTADPAAVKAQRAELAANFVPVPAYNLIAIGDAATDSEQIALLALVYTDQADAEAAAALFPAQLTDFESFAYQRPFSDVLTERGVTSVEASVYPASSGRSVMVLTLRASLPDADTASSMAFGVLINAFIRRDVGWLAMEF
ncbi:MAG: hypothetical protein IT319_22405 [Anaerolineae bacterium]|nr:hypothetical protein [Anaerolineae bacterium]